METTLEERRRNDHQSFWCPNGHEQHFTSETEADRLKRQLQIVAQERDEATRARQWAESRAKGANIAAGKAKAASKRLLDRLECGVCPHCHRTFKQLAAHMKAKHAKVVTR